MNPSEDKQRVLIFFFFFFPSSKDATTMLAENYDMFETETYLAFCSFN